MKSCKAFSHLFVDKVNDTNTRACVRRIHTSRKNSDLSGLSPSRSITGGEISHIRHDSSSGFIKCCRQLENPKRSSTLSVA